MPKKKKKLLVLLIILIVVLLIFLAIVIIIPKLKQGEKSNILFPQNSQDTRQTESNFSNMFSNIDYSTDDQDIVSTAYEYKEEKEDEYEIDVHFPKINFETCDEINNEIIEVLGTKLIDIVNNADNIEYTKYKVDYISYKNNGIISLIIKCVLKEGNNPQRVMIQTYNYDVSDEKLVTLPEIMESKNLETRKAQSQINSIIRKKNENTENYADQGYNIYVRDIESSIYEISNIENYFLDEDGKLYVIFAYGNKSFTETVDVIKID